MATIKIDDDLAARYSQIAEESRQPLQQVIERQLARFADYPSTVRVLPLARDDLQQIEHLLGGGSITSPKALVDRIRAYASITLGTITLDLSAAQKEEIAYRAQKRGLTPDAVAREMCDIVLEQIFQAVTPYR